MKKVLLLLSVCLACSACSSYRNKEHLWSAFRLRTAPALTVQWYHVGALNNLTSAYLTDSTAFCRYLGTFDEESEIIAVLVNGDQIVVEKSDNGRQATEPRAAHQTVYSLRQLRLQHAFE